MGNGASSFNMPLLLDTGEVTVYEVIVPGGLYSAQHFGVGNFRVTFKAIVRDFRYIDQESLELITSWDDSIEEFLTSDNPLDVFVNATLPGYLGE